MSGALDRIRDRRDDLQTLWDCSGTASDAESCPCERCQALYKLDADLADLEALVKAATPIVETWDLHASDYLAELVDGHEMRVLRAVEVAEMIEQQKALAAALARVLGEEQT